jgi:hypothetical protein
MRNGFPDHVSVNLFSDKGMGEDKVYGEAHNGDMTLHGRRRDLLITAGFVFLLGAMTSQAAAAEGLPLSVCDAIAKRIENNGRVVDVRGEVMAGGHGIYMASDKCANELDGAGVTWPNFINLVFANNHSPNPYDHAPFETDQQSIEAADKYALQAGYRAGVDRKVATYTGLFLMWPDVGRQGKVSVQNAIILGFGPVGLRAPAQLVIKAIKDISVVRVDRQRERLKRRLVRSASVPVL